MNDNRTDAALAVLRIRFAQRYTIHLCGSLWVANPRADEVDTAPTIIEGDLNLFVRALIDPPARVGRPLPGHDKGNGSRSPGLATDGDTEPTIMRDTSAELERPVRVPQSRGGRWDSL